MSPFLQNLLGAKCAGGLENEETCQTPSCLVGAPIISRFIAATVLIRLEPDSFQQNVLNKSERYCVIGPMLESIPLALTGRVLRWHWCLQCGRVWRQVGRQRTENMGRGTAQMTKTSSPREEGGREFRRQGNKDCRELSGRWWDLWLFSFYLINITFNPHNSAFTAIVIQWMHHSIGWKQVSLTTSCACTLLTCDDSGGPGTTLVWGSLDSERAVWKKI